MSELNIERRRFLRGMMGAGLGLGLAQLLPGVSLASGVPTTANQDLLLDATVSPNGRLMMLFSGARNDYVRVCEPKASLASSRQTNLPEQFVALGTRWNERIGRPVVFGAWLEEVSEEYSYDLTYALPIELQPLARIIPTVGRHRARSLVAFPATGSLTETSFTMDPLSRGAGGYVVDVSSTGSTARLVASTLGSDPSRLAGDALRSPVVIDHLSAFHQAVLQSQQIYWVRRDIDGAAVVSTGQTESYRFPSTEGSRLRLSADVQGRLRIVEISSNGQWINSMVSTGGKGWQKTPPPAAGSRSRGASDLVTIPLSNEVGRAISIDMNATVWVTEVL